MSNATVGILMILALLAFGIVACFVESWLIRRRERRWLRLNPMFKVGGDAKNFMGGLK